MKVTLLKGSPKKIKNILLIIVAVIICQDVLYYENGVLYNTTVCMEEDVYNMKEEVEI